MNQPQRPARLDRRRLLLAGAAVPVSAALPAGCARPGPDYAAAVADTWRDTIPDSVQNRDQLEREIVRFATLAPSHRNRQPWRFELGPGWIRVQPDPARRLPVSDPDDHHLQVSLGAAIETMVVSAAAGGLYARVVPDGDGARVEYAVGVPTVPQLYAAIIRRQTARAPFSAEALPAPLLRELEVAAGVAGAPAVVVTDRGQIARILELTVLAAERQFRDPAWLAELQAWIRYDANEALNERDGVYTAANGYATVPRWLGSRLFDLVTTPARERVRYTDQFAGCGALLVIASPQDDAAGWRAAGRGYQRAALVATSQDVRSAPANPALDFPELRAQLAAEAGLGTARASVVLRLGRGGAELPRSLRRPAADVTTGQG